MGFQHLDALLTSMSHLTAVKHNSGCEMTQEQEQVTVSLLRAQACILNLAS